jgi:hypothetical protein
LRLESTSWQLCKFVGEDSLASSVVAGVVGRAVVLVIAVGSVGEEELDTKSALNVAREGFALIIWRASLVSSWDAESIAASIIQSARISIVASKSVGLRVEFAESIELVTLGVLALGNVLEDGGAILGNTLAGSVEALIGISAGLSVVAGSSIGKNELGAQTSIRNALRGEAIGRIRIDALRVGRRVRTAYT